MRRVGILWQLLGRSGNLAWRPDRRKRRTREHVIANLSVNFLEHLILVSGCSAERVAHDYGIDLLMFTYNEHGEIQNGHVQFQLKATDRLAISRGQSTIAWRVATADLRYWMFEPWPVVLLVFDAVKKQGFWLDIQDYDFDQDVAGVQETMTVHIPTTNKVSAKSVQRWRGLMDRVLDSWRRQS
jgi:hypothetical protein